MLKVVWNIVKYFLGIFQKLVYPAKRLICRRRKLSTSDVAELTSIGTGDGLQMTNSVSGSLPHNSDDIQMEAWDSWGNTEGQGHQQQHNNYYGPPSAGGRENAYNYQEKQSSSNGQAARQGNGQHIGGKQKKPEPEPEPDINFFEDMTPSVKKQKKFLIRKREAAEGPSPSFSNRLSVTTNVPLQTSELESWEDSNNAWEDNPESVEDLSWQAEEAIREKKRKDRLERQMEQQRKKQRKEETRGMKGGSLAATRLS